MHVTLTRFFVNRVPIACFVWVAVFGVGFNIERAAADAARVSSSFRIVVDAIGPAGNTQQSGGFRLSAFVGQGTSDIAVASTQFALLSGYGFQFRHVNPSFDLDSDGLSNLAEFLNATDPSDVDTDDDLMPDLYEVTNGLLPLNPNDALLDADADGFSNLEEFRSGTDPTDAASNLAVRAIPGIINLILSD